ncbi:MOSC domain-containing protein [Shewanella sp. JM162201]|uniref:MOSC domain-containing protein n=1 Tax=Shewanella jiangmenensis TaxID=2837387 RepID=A0ABS5V299_9GAMM|nr:MOSC N-terminal beta barrel domain-containing protein [Shewanella jiangmenensis]MBT1444588.1 MOSC domain-containing protein [Shewanella jiangmenensis]
MAQLSDISIYPVKSMGAQRLSRAQVTLEGLMGDRRFMAVKPNGEFITARTHPKLLKVEPQGSDEQTHCGELWLRAENMPELRIPASEFSKEPMTTGVWKDSFSAFSTTPLADAWISTLLGESARILWLGETSARFREKTGTAVSFADGYPLLLIGEASLTDLNLRADALCQMSQFRTNLVASTREPFEEDSWKRIRIGEVEFLVAKPCSRCVMTTVIAGTTEFHPRQEPLATLSKYRKSASGDVNFGQNLIALNSGQIRVGDKIEVLETQEAEHYRSLAPAKRLLTLRDKAAIARDFYRLSFAAADGKPLPGAIAGQHLPFAFDIDGTRHIRRYSLTHPTGDGLYHIAVKRTQNGLISNWLIDNLATGDTVLGGRAEGRFTPKASAKLTLISAGSGITPMLAMLRAAIAKARLSNGNSAPLGHIHFIYQCRTEEDIPETALLAKCAAAGMTLEIWLSAMAENATVENAAVENAAIKNAAVETAAIKNAVVENTAMGSVDADRVALKLSETGTESEASTRYQTLPTRPGRWQASTLSPSSADFKAQGREVFICGPQGFMEAARDGLLALGVDDANIHIESFGGLASSANRPVKSVQILLDEKPFQGSNQQSLLSQAEAHGRVIPWSCRAGICGSCKCYLLEGEVHQPKAEALSDSERRDGVILACSATPLTDIRVSLKKPS